ncbi:hypothetical protein DV736_g561, partial [Chaetothyriales sp. CBS 134916]
MPPPLMISQQSLLRSLTHTRDTFTEHPDWRNYTFIEVFIQNLPVQTKTVDIHRNLMRYGNIILIILKEKRDGDRSSNADVIFKPPPAIELWRPGLEFKFRLSDGTTSCIKFKLSRRQKKNFSVDSPVRPGVTYDQELTLDAKSIDFGVLRSQRKMTVMRSVERMRKDNTSVVTSFTLNLFKMQMEIKFPVYLCSTNGDRIREYRFWIALDDKFSIWQMQHPNGDVSCILHVTDPPWYSRRLKQMIAASHTEDSNIWREDDLWTRQTDIVHAKSDFAEIDEKPVSIQKNGNTINIARWTTFRVNLSQQSWLDQGCVLVKALNDFSIKIVQMDAFEIDKPAAPYEAPFWSLLPSVAEKSSRSTDLLAHTQADLPFAMRYQLEVCISQGWLSEYDITAEFLMQLRAQSEHKAIQTLIQVDMLRERVFDPMSIFTNIKYQKPVRARQLPPNCVEVRHVIVTATGMKLLTPSIEQSNRVFRLYKSSADYFLRVRFEDDEYRGQTKLYSSSNNKMELIFRRVKRTMTHGISIAGRHYEFLAWGNSQLREHSCYFFSKAENGLTAEKIRAEMGVFDHEKIVAKRAARMGQCFSTTSAIPVQTPMIERSSCIPDITNGKYTFTDGVGKMSLQLACLIHSHLRIVGSVPSCFQFRLGGCKGVLTVDPTLRGVDLKVRESQFKFGSRSKELEIIRSSQFWQPYLNRQLITVLSNLGVPDNIFLEMQKSMIEALDAAMKDDSAALKALRDNVDPNGMTLKLCDLVSNGFRQSHEPFVMSILNLWRAWSLKYIKEKAKIRMPEGCFVLGVVDETGTLRGHVNALQMPDLASRNDKEKCLPEIFVQFTDPQTNRKRIVEGICIIARNPSLHRGDVRVVKAINVPALHHLCDVVVMPQNGDRDLPSMCSGGDLDGDDYIVCWDKRLIPPVWNAEPFHYNAPEPKRVSGDITVEDIISFFIDYLRNDRLGRIAHAHLAASDFYDDGIQNANCLELVHLHSKAVDYPKTGVPAELPRRLERRDWPHFMEKKTGRYISKKVLGQLYDAAKRENAKLRTERRFDSRILNGLSPSSHMKKEAAVLKYDYDVAMQQIMARFKIGTEFEVWSTFVLHHSKASQDYKFHEEIGQISRALKEQFYEAIVTICGGNTFQHLAEFAVAAYQVTTEAFLAATEIRLDVLNEKQPLISFPWLLSDTLSQIATASATQDDAPAIGAGGAQKTAQQAQTESQSSRPIKQELDVLGTAKQTTAVEDGGEITKDKVTGSKLPPPLQPSSLSLPLPFSPNIAAGHSRSGKVGKTKSSNSDPFMILDPFNGIQTNKPRPKAKSLHKGIIHARPTIPAPVMKRQDMSDSTGSGGSDVSSSLVHFSHDSLSESSKVESVTSGLGAVEEDDWQLGKHEAEAEATSSVKSHIHRMALNNDRMMKDPAQMTTEELAALGLGDDDGDDGL